MFNGQNIFVNIPLKGIFLPSLEKLDNLGLSFKHVEHVPGFVYCLLSTEDSKEIILIAAVY